MDDSQTFLDALAGILTQLGSFNSLDVAPPAAVFWPDMRCEWEQLIPLLRQRMPVLTLGSYEPSAFSGPSAWLRCMLASTLEDAPTWERPPLVYLPGISAAHFLNTKELPQEVTLLADLRYRSVVWSHPDGLDWTPYEFFTGKRPSDKSSQNKAAESWLFIHSGSFNRQGLQESSIFDEYLSQPIGLQIEARHDLETREALNRALPILATKTIAQLRADAPWKAKDFEALLGFKAQAHETSIVEIIARGESRELEFKATARVDIATGRKEAFLEHNIVKAVAAFLNSEHGGTLLIGVNDDGSIRGIEADYSAWSKQEDRCRDKYELWLMKLLQDAYGKQFGHCIRVTFHAEDGKDVCRIRVAPAPKPVFVKEGNDERFYVRTGNSSPWLKLSEALDYIKTRWGYV